VPGADVLDVVELPLVSLGVDGSIDSGRRGELRRHFGAETDDAEFLI
jgi:hypothetical protein